MKEGSRPICTEAKRRVRARVKGQRKKTLGSKLVHKRLRCSMCGVEGDERVCSEMRNSINAIQEANS